MSNSTSLSTDEASVSSGTRVQDFGGLFNPLISSFNSPHDHQEPQKLKKKRNLPGNPDPDAEVIALSPKTLLATNRFVCEICNKGFQRDQNLQLHRRGHNLPWKLKQRSSKEIKKRAYVCPEPTCVHHHPSRALGDLTGIKKHYCRKHGEKKWKCEKCSKIYAVQSDWKAHSKTCGTREYRCDCGTLFSRKDSFITHRAFCDALAEESARLSANQLATTLQPLFPNFPNISHHHHHFLNRPPFHIHTQTLNNNVNPWDPPHNNPNPSHHQLHHQIIIKPEESDHRHFQIPPPPSAALILPPEQQQQQPQPLQKSISMNISTTSLHVAPHSSATSAHLSATALLQKAASVGPQPAAGGAPGHMAGLADVGGGEFLATWQKSDRFTRDFLGLTAVDHGNGRSGGDGAGDRNGAVDISVSVKDMLTYAGGVEFAAYHEREGSLLKPQGFGFAAASASETWGDC
ncbi:Zinc finger protein MAGPIE [Morus notabilis]|uniref:Zinc finger protein MAGPIE n=2 Tax=Morus notabilis TaxID=981085 RepID=W9QJG2_9ROSA|nr:Zinc finger protein MAGPIE [Morus notabilis]